MRIVHVTAGIQETCGVSQYVVNTARAQQAAGHEVTIITTMTCGFPVADLDVVLVSEPTAALAAALGAGRADAIVHIHSMWSGYIHRAAAWCRVHGVPYVASPHGSATPWAMRYKRWKKIPAWWLYQRRDFRGAAGFHATVPEEESDIRRLGMTQPVVIAPLGADVVAAAEEEAVSATGMRDVVFLSRIHPKKNVGALLRAWGRVRTKAPDLPCRLVIAGSDDIGHQAELVALARGLGLETVDFSHDLEYGKKQVFGGGEVPVGTFQKRLATCRAEVVFTGPVYAAAKDWMFAHAWVSVLPSHSENFGGVVVESLAQGTPVIASRGTPWRDLEGCDGVGRSGWWVGPTPAELAEALEEALALDAAGRAELSRQARALVAAKYSWSASARRVLALYERVLKEGGSR